MTPNANYQRWQIIGAALDAAQENAGRNHIKDALRQLHNAAAACGTREEFQSASDHIKHALWEISRWRAELTANTPSQTITAARAQIELDPNRELRRALHEGYKARKAAREAQRRGQPQ